MFVTSLQTYAFTIYESNGAIIKESVKYDPVNDFYWLDFYDKEIPQSQRAVRVNFRNYSDSSYTKINNDKNITATSQGGSYFTGFIFNCNTFYELFVYNSSDSLIGYTKFHATEIKVPVCDSGANSDSIEKDENENCICCFEIQKLTQTNSQIKDTLLDIKPQLQTISNQIGQSIQKSEEIKQALYTINNQFTTDKDFAFPVVNNNPSYIKPKTDTHNFKDETTYFVEGDRIEDSPPLPKAPEPKDWEGVKKDNELVKEESLLKEVFDVEPTLKTDMFNMDSIMSQDNPFTKDNIFSPSPIMETEQMRQDTVLVKEETYKHTHVLEKTNNFDVTETFDRQGFFNRTNIFD